VFSIFAYRLWLEDTAVRASLSGSTVTVVLKERFLQGFHWAVRVMCTESVRTQGKRVLVVAEVGVVGWPPGSWY
jgi:hypothetical protein